MKMNGNTILITGGATGIGFSMAKYFQARGNTVIICGRRGDRLEQAKAEISGLHTIKCDVSDPDDRNLLFESVSKNFPSMNILINNAGIQQDIDLTKVTESKIFSDEIRINFEAPVCLSALFTPLLSGKDNATIVNVSSGLAFVPQHSVGMPVYCATKAALHTFSIVQRKQLETLGIRVVELLPPMVESELNTEGRKKRNMQKTPYMMSSDDFVRQALEKMEQDTEEIRAEK